jgi:hypothetical protein
MEGKADKRLNKSRLHGDIDNLRPPQSNGFSSAARSRDVADTTQRT